MANKFPLFGGNRALDPDDRMMYAEISPGVFAQVTATVILSGAGDTNVNIEPSLTDEITSALVTITTVHHEVHEGETFETNLFTPGIANGVMIMILLRTGSKYAHLTFTTAAGADAQVRLIENPTVTNDGADLNVFNMKRYSTEAAETLASSLPTYAGGTVLTNFLVPGGSGGNSQGGTSRQDTEWILSRNTSYVIELTNIAVGNQPASITPQWYEESTA